MAENFIKRSGKRTPFRSAANKTPRKVTSEEPVSQKAAAPADVAGVRIQKVLADAGVGSRRAMEAKIEEGRVTVNGVPATIGQRVVPTDVIRFDGRIIKRAQADKDALPKVLIYHKPAGEIVSRDDPEGRPNVFAHLPRVYGSRWINVGRLDFNTEGLLIFTTDGALANYLMHPCNEISREYAVRVQGTMSPEAREKLLSGIKLEDGVAKFKTLEEGGGKGFNRWYNVTLNEGRNREVRRMFEAVELPVSRLIRVKYGTLSLPEDLSRGKYRFLSEDEIQAWLEAIGFKIGSDRPRVSNSGSISKPRTRTSANAPKTAPTQGRRPQRKGRTKSGTYGKDY